MNKQLICILCGAEFCMDEQERQMYSAMGYENPPKRCKACRGARRALESAVKPEKIMYSAICDACGKETLLPFKPNGDKPVYCKACYDIRKKI